MKFEFVSSPSDSAAVAVICHDEKSLSAAAERWDKATGGAVKRAVGASRFKGGKGQLLNIAAPAGVTASSIVLVGAGPKADLDDHALEFAAASAFGAVKTSGAAVFAIDASDLSAAQAARAAYAAQLASYRFDKYLTREKPEKKPSVAAVEIVCGDTKAAKSAFKPLSAVADAVAFARDLVSEPANTLYPVEFAKRCKSLEKLGLSVEVLGESEMAKLGMRTLLAVGQGSEHESQLVVLRWDGAGKAKSKPIAFVGKGVCFDSGGLSLKPPEAMEDMKWDMGGAAAVAGLMMALAGRKAKVDAVGVLGLVENMPDGKAQRPGDIVKSMSGQTIEVLNTDAEGRLVLADALWYTKERFKPQIMIDLATLTGAMIIALGNDYAGVFSNDDKLVEALLAASSATGEKLWRMPLPPEYDRLIDSPAADMKNSAGRAGGSITAAMFLQRFVDKTPWAHIDIAPTAWKKDSRVPTTPDGATGFGVRLLDRLVADRYEA